MPLFHNLVGIDQLYILNKPNPINQHNPGQGNYKIINNPIAVITTPEIDGDVIYELAAEIETDINKSIEFILKNHPSIKYYEITVPRSAQFIQKGLDKLKLVNKMVTVVENFWNIEDNITELPEKLGMITLLEESDITIDI